MAEERADEAFDGLDWYAREFDRDRYVECVFREVDLTEARSHGAVFERCEFHNCRFNASEHRESAFVGCEFRRTSFFTAVLDG